MYFFAMDICVYIYIYIYISMNGRIVLYVKSSFISISNKGQRTQYISVRYHNVKSCSNTNSFCIMNYTMIYELNEHFDVIG